MAKVNRCLRLSFIIFNGIFACIGVMMVYATFKATVFSSQVPNVGSGALAGLWTISITILSIACLGLYAGKSEKILLLKIFAGFMIVGLIAMIILGIIMAVAKSQFMEAFRNSPEITDAVMQDSSLKEALDELQQHGHCCGVYGATDWGASIPHTCDCNYKTEGVAQFGLGESTCDPKPLGASGPSMIYARPCVEVIVSVLNLLFHILIGIFFGFAVIALIGLLFSFLMIRRIQRHDEMGVPGLAMKGF